MGEISENDLVLLDQEVCALQEKAQFLSDVYGVPANIEVLNTTCPVAFSLIQRTFVDSVILGIVRIVRDSFPSTLTLQRIAKQAAGTELGERLGQMLAHLEDWIAPLKSHRDKRIAHHDERVATSLGLPDITVIRIEECLSLIRDFMNEITRSRSCTYVDYTRIFSSDDGTDVIHSLKQSLRLNDLQKRAWSGESIETLFEELKKDTW